MANGQAQQRWSIGPRVGVNVSNVSSTNNFFATVDGIYIGQNQMATGVSAGVGVLYSHNDRFGLGLDALFSQRGYRADVMALANTVSVTQRLNYLEVPLTFRYFLTRSGGFSPNLYVGPVVSALISAVSYSNRTDLRLRNNADFRPLELGLTAGAQLNFRLGDRRRFTIDGRYTYGVTDAQLVVAGTHNQFVTLGIGYNFGISRLY